ncbi:ABC transporter, membrane spanning protein [Rhodovulum sp. P5]|uniref:carbohydrate ABC transporter permease n=1 Tax=Rhodovulum sp. P5 TaxID=1564506 RepID=UPI0009C2560D|nr:sugar ABC transporter permease [Rhodovulum sp. P5]ARE40340.1 ABC transporter, membrane spanning protein [Rhodovulum sp. P5]
MTEANRRALADKALFLGPAALLLVLFFLAPIFVNFFVAFSDMAQTVRFDDFPTTKQFNKLGHLDPEAFLGIDLRRSFYKALMLTLVFVVLTLGLFNVTFALILALATTAIPPRMGAFFRAVWLLPRMSPSVVYALLWLWVIDSSERGLFNQIVMFAGLPQMNLKLDHPMAVIVVANGLIGASLGVIIFTSAIRSIPEHLFHAARADGAGPLSIARHVVLPALRWPISYITIYQALALLVSFEYIFLIMGPARSTMTMAMLSYTKSLAPQIGGGQYAYGAAIATILIVIGIVVALVMWRLTNMKALLQRPRIEVR